MISNNKKYQITPIFIGGCSRSGTTMLGRILGSAMNSFSTPESHFKFKLLAGEYDQNIQSLVKQNFRIKLWEIDQHLEKLDYKKSKADIINELLVAYTEVHQLKFTDKKIYWIDHTPGNLRYHDLLLDHFPNAKFIHIIRDPRAVTSSILPLDWGPTTIPAAIKLWYQEVTIGLAVCGFKERHNSIQIRYEDIIGDPDSVHMIASELGLLELYTKNQKDIIPSYTRHQHKLVDQKPDQLRIRAWEKELSKRDVEIVESQLKGLMQALGYDLTNSNPKGISYKELIIDNIKGYLLKRKNRKRNQIRKEKAINGK